MFKIGLVEDEKNLSQVVEKYLKAEGFEVLCFYNGEDAMNSINSMVDLWVLDIMLPGEVTGYDLIKSIRATNPNMPVIFASARSQDIDKIMGLELGSDDYIGKPYSPRELVLRVKNVLNRTYPDLNNVEKLVKLGDYTVNFDRRTVFLGSEALNLTSKEYDLLLFLVNNKGKAFSRDQILNNVWGDDYFGSDRVVDDLMRRLRQKMPGLNVETIYGYGYRLL